MMSNGDLNDRIKTRLFRSHFNSNRRGYFAQARSGIGLIWRSNGKFQQANGLWDGDDTYARESSLSTKPGGAKRGRIHPRTGELSPGGATDLSPAIHRWESFNPQTRSRYPACDSGVRATTEGDFRMAKRLARRSTDPGVMNVMGIYQQ